MLHHFTIELPFLEEDKQALCDDLVGWLAVNLEASTYHVVRTQRVVHVHLRKERDIFLSLLRFSDIMVAMSI